MDGSNGLTDVETSERIRLMFVVVLALLAVQMLLAAFGINLFGARR